MAQNDDEIDRNAGNILGAINLVKYLPRKTLGKPMERKVSLGINQKEASR